MNNYQNDAPISRISRRRLLAALPALALIKPILAAGGYELRIRKINCFELRVSDVERSVKFYQQLFGMPVQARNGGRVCLGVGNGPAFMAIRKLEAGEKPDITYIGYSVDSFDLAKVQAALKQLGFDSIQPPALSVPGIDNAMKQWVRMRGDTPELYFADARGLIVQLSDSSYCGGTGKLGNVCGKPEASPTPGLFKLTQISHFTAFVSNGAEANKFYQDTFALKVQAYQGPGAPVTGIGDGKQFVMYAGGGPGPGPGGGGAKTPASINHGCFNMEGFKVDDVLAKLTAQGLKARPEGQGPGQATGPLMHYVSLRQPNRGGAEGGTPELYFTDIDGILMQLQDTTYCGGGGYLGSECLKN